jgi:hypothetical protein
VCLTPSWRHRVRISPEPPRFTAVKPCSENSKVVESFGGTGGFRKYFRRNWFIALLAVGAVAAVIAWRWYFPSHGDETAKSQAVSSLLSFITSAILAAMTWFYLQTTRETLLEIRAENLLKVPDIRVTVRGSSYNLAAVAGNLWLGIDVHLHIQNVSRASFSVNFKTVEIDGLSASIRGEFIVGETTVEQRGPGTAYSTPTERYVYLEEGGAYEGKLQIKPIGRSVGPEDAKRIKEHLTGRIYLGFPRDQEREIPFTSRPSNS